MAARTEASPPPKLEAVRDKITELVARNAVPMVQQAIDAVRDEGQYQAIKYLFEMVGLYPVVTQESSEADDSLAHLLLEKLGLSEPLRGDGASNRAKLRSRTPVE